MDRAKILDQIRLRVETDWYSDNPPYAERLESARQAINLEPQELSARTGITDTFCLLGDDGELSTCLTLKEVCLLADVLKIPIWNLVAPDPAGPRPPPITLKDIQAEAKKVAESLNLSDEEFGDLSNWDIAVVRYEHPLEEWNLDCLKSLCAFAGLDWLSSANAGFKEC